MQRKLLFILFLIVGNCLYAHAQDCTEISYPLTGANEIPVDATITWPALQGINGYLLSIGTTPGGTEIENGLSLGLVNSYKPPLGFPENTRVYVSLSVIQFTTIPQLCSQISFVTTNVTTPPPCTVLTAPDNEASYVTVVTDIIWEYAPTATGYLLSIGTTSGGTDILNDFNVGNVLSYDPPEDLPQGTQIFIKVTPVNENGSLGNCTEESFFTGPGFDICEPIIDEETGETILTKPNITFPSLVGICSDELPYIITSNDVGDGYRWYKTNVGEPETLISEERSAAIVEPGKYILEVYNIINYLGIDWECASTQLVTLVASEAATIDTIEKELLLTGERQITIYASGDGDYEYALDNENGPYQDSPVFENIQAGEHVAYVRDKNGCGTTQRTVDRDISSEDFPNFFTPNGDGYNDFWNFVPPPENFGITLERIYIFDRYGTLIKQMDADSQGWDGTFNGRQIPSSDYWFRATFDNQQKVSGHFTLKR
ncbi:T9SS type B sorting domain-containing protein [Maribacter chungangensis]|uniref:T9SS type B sorting domain-containing protein n=1 Tax=Maribacter chungangensis TaxID=1069117 RepID=A0ABW3B2A8_9FLAO